MYATCASAKAPSPATKPHPEQDVAEHRQDDPGEQERERPDPTACERDPAAIGHECDEQHGRREHPP